MRLVGETVNFDGSDSTAVISLTRGLLALMRRQRAVLGTCRLVPIVRSATRR